MKATKSIRLSTPVTLTIYDGDEQQRPRIFIGDNRSWVTSVIFRDDLLRLRDWITENVHDLPDYEPWLGCAND